VWYKIGRHLFCLDKSYTWMCGGILSMRCVILTSHYSISILYRNTLGVGRTHVYKTHIYETYVHEFHTILNILFLNLHQTGVRAKSSSRVSPSQQLEHDRIFDRRMPFSRICKAALGGPITHFFLHVVFKTQQAVRRQFWQV
jgi:hypothetical protein